jgi:thiamine transport system permease protein
VIATPFVLQMLMPTLRAIPPAVRDAAAMSGAPPWRVALAIDVPLARRALTAGAALAFAVSVGEFGASAFLVRADTPTAPTALARLLGRPGEAAGGTAAALAICLGAVTAISLLLMDYWLSADRADRSDRANRRWR